MARDHRQKLKSFTDIFDLLFQILMTRVLALRRSLKTKKEKKPLRRPRHPTHPRPAPVLSHQLPPLCPVQEISRRLRHRKPQSVAGRPRVVSSRVGEALQQPSRQQLPRLPPQPPPQVRHLHPLSEAPPDINLPVFYLIKLFISCSISIWTSIKWKK